MEASGQIGTVGTYDAKLSAGVATVSVGLQVDLAAMLTAEAAKVTSTTEKDILLAAAGILKQIS